MMHLLALLHIPRSGLSFSAHGNHKVVDIYESVLYDKENPEGVAYMFKIIEDMRNEAALKAKVTAKIEDIRNVMETFKVDAEKAMDALKIPAADRQLYAAQL